MADLNDINSALQVKLTGQDATGLETNPINSSSTGRLFTVDGANGATGSAVPTTALLAGGTDGTNLRGISVNASGQLVIAPLTNSSIVKAQLQDNSGSAITLGQKTMANSLPVVIASDQSAIPVTQSTSPWIVAGNVASGATDSGNPVKVGGVFNTAFPTLTTGQRGDIQLDSSARQVIAPLTNASIVKSQLQDNAGNGITSTTINTKQRLDVNTASEGTAGSTVPFQTIQVGGSDGTNLRAIAVDTSGRQKIAASSYFHPIFSLRIQAVPAATVALATSLAVPISSSSSGSLIAVMVSSSVAGTVTVTDNLAQTYTSAISGTSGTHTNYIFYKANSAAGVTTVTISSTVSSGITTIITEYYGISSTPLDRTATATVAVAAFSSGSTAATTSAVELLLGSAHGTTKNNLTYTAGTGWTSVGTSNAFNAGAGQLYVEDQYVTATGAYAATGTASANDTIIADIATFIVTNTNLMALNQAKVIKSGAGILRKIIINTVGTGSPTLTLYDNTVASPATVIANLSLGGFTESIEYNLNFTTGLTISVNSFTADFTLVYE